MDNYSDHIEAVAAVLSTYFRGVFNGDTAMLRTVFHPQTLLSGEVKGVPYFKTLDQYLEGVGNRKSPAEGGETFKMEIIAIEIINSIAIAKVHLPMFDFNYYNLLSLSRVDGKWLIVNKLLTHVNN